MANRKSRPLNQEAAEFHEALSELLRVYQFRDRKRICCYDISVTQCYALDALIRREPLTQNELAAELYLDKSTASRVVATLERKGYVSRRTDREDRRAVRLRVTRAGKRLHLRIIQDSIEQHQNLLADFDPEVRQATTQIIARLAREAISRFSRIDGSCSPAKSAIREVADLPA